MAGNRLSPRQKMINMMYLVLTALLALNVSAEILQAFESLRASLHNSAASQAIANATLSDHIITSIEKKEQNGTSPYSYVKGLVKDINGQSERMVAYLDSLNEQLVQIAERDPETKEFIKKDEVDKNHRFWLGDNDVANDGRGNGAAITLRQKLNNFHEWANKLLAQYDTTGNFPRIAPLVTEPKDDSTITNAESKAKKWEYHTFYGKPVIADMAMVEKMKTDIRETQTVLLNLARKLSDASVYTIDSLIGFEAPSAQVVAAGMKFQTTIGVGVAAKNIQPEFMGNGIKINPGGSTATMTVTANGAVIPNGAYEGIQHYTAMIKVPTASGGIQEIPIKGQFRVRLPEVVVRSKELQILYKDCGNTVNVDVPALGDEYNPDFSKSTGGKVIRSQKDRKEITIVPTAQKFDLDVSSNTNGQLVRISKLTYRVVQPPKPSITMAQRGNRVGGTQPINKKIPVTIKVAPDTEFAAALSRDARYRAAKIKVLFKDGLGPAKTVKEVSGADIQKGVEIDLNFGELRQAAPGAKVFFEIEGLKRINFEGNASEIPGFTVYDLTLPAILN